MLADDLDVVIGVDTYEDNLEVGTHEDVSAPAIGIVPMAHVVA